MIVKRARADRAFWDSSALVPLFCRDPFTSKSRQLLRRFPGIVIWWGTPVEILSAFVRMEREARIMPADVRIALDHVSAVRLRWREVLPVDEVRSLAEEALDRYSIRTADAFQLAAALVWCREKPRGKVFLSFDSELKDAARHAGFDTAYG